MRGSTRGAAPGEVFPFLVGFARSGTTLLRAMIDSHPEIAVPPESQFVTELAYSRGAYERPDGFDIERFVDDLAGRERFVRWGMPTADLRAMLIEAPPSDYPSAIRSVYSAWAAREGKQRYGDKTPNTLGGLDLIAALFPEARFVHLIRDGRDVAVAFTDAFGGSAVAAISRWRAQVLRGRRSGEALGAARYLEIRYEDLVADPAAALKVICDFIDLPFSDLMLTYPERAEVYRGQQTHPEVHRHLDRAPIVGLRDWRREMPAHVASACETVAGDLLTSLGYEAAPSAGRLRGKALAARMYLEQSRRHLRAGAARHLPRRKAGAAPAATSPGATRSDPPWPDLLQRSLLRISFLDDDTASSEWQAVRATLVLDDITDGETQRLLPLVYRRLVALGVGDPELSRLKGLHRHAWYQNQLKLNEVAPFLALVEGAGIETMVVKGVPLALCFYGDLGSRPMNDVDVLVRTDRMADVLRLLEHEGWVSPPDRRQRRPPLTEPFSLTSYHSRRVTSPDGFVVDLHWHLREQFVLPRRELASSDDFWAAAEPLEVAGVRTRAPCATDLLLHAIVHGLASRRDARAHWAADALVLVARSGAVDWERFVQQTERRRLVLVMRSALRYLVENVDAAVPSDVLTELDRLPTTRYDADAYERALSPDSYSSSVRGLFDLGPAWSWRRAHLGSVGAALDLPAFLRDTWNVPTTWHLPAEGARRLVRRVGRRRDDGAATATGADARSEARLSR